MGQNENGSLSLIPIFDSDQGLTQLDTKLLAGGDELQLEGDNMGYVGQEEDMDGGGGEFMDDGVGDMGYEDFGQRCTRSPYLLSCTIGLQ